MVNTLQTVIFAPSLEGVPRVLYESSAARFAAAAANW